jgi:uncharacterized membrane protein
MKTATVVGIILIVVGIIALAYQGFTYRSNKRVLDAGPIHVNRTEHHFVPLSPVLGGIALVGGIILLVAGAKSSP